MTLGCGNQKKHLSSDTLSNPKMPKSPVVLAFSLYQLELVEIKTFKFLCRFQRGAFSLKVLHNFAEVSLFTRNCAVWFTVRSISR